jgi:4-diphosphocytidyl-2-C-methyl-D-erythritol kinase
MSAELRCRSYAKINVYLDVLNRRPDGFHNIETIFQTVGLWDELVCTAQPSGLVLECSVPGLSNGPDNLVHRAATLLQDRTGCTKGAHLILKKNIPIAAGLAGGSGNAAACLVVLNDLWGLELSPETLREYALELGSDVPYCMLGGTAAATGRGEELAPLDALAETWFVLVHPPLHVSAAQVYGSPLLRRNSQEPTAGRTTGFQRAIDLLGAGDLPGLIFNTMEEPVFHDYPELAQLKGHLLDAGCSAAAMSGSGPTVFGVAASETQARTVVRTLHEHTTSVVPCVAMGLALTR